MIDIDPQYFYINKLVYILRKSIGVLVGRFMCLKSSESMFGIKAGEYSKIFIFIF